MSEGEVVAKPVYRPDQPLDTPQAAEYATVSVSLLSKLRMTGGGPEFYVVGGKMIRYTPRLLDKWLQQDRRKCTSAPMPTNKRKRKARR